MVCDFGNTFINKILKPTEYRLEEVWNGTELSWNDLFVVQRYPNKKGAKLLL